jgi:hypothetical protein
MLKTKPNKSLYPPGITKTEIIKRARYLNIRISSLFDDFSEWIKDLPEYKLKGSSVEISGKDKKLKYKLPAAEVSREGKKIAEIKPAGLFAFGYNCRIDIISNKGTGIVIDASEEKEDPDWQIIPMEAGKNPKKLNKIIFRNLLKRLSNSMKD